MKSTKTTSLHGDDMKGLLIDVIGLSGFSLLSAGVYLSYGLPVSLMVSGALLLVICGLAQRGHE